MSFRRRGDILNSPNLPQRNEGKRVHNLATLSGNPLQRNSPAVRGTVRIDQSLETKREKESKQNPCVKPSTVTSRPTISTGAADLDRILMHLGLPLGSSLVIEESGSTDFGSILLKYFASQSIIQNRIDKDKKYGHVISLGVPPQWGNELPGLYQGSSKDQKRALVNANENKISVSNLSEKPQAVLREQKDLKIAWRYGLQKKVQNDSEESESSNKYYCSQFDLTRRLLPIPSAHDITFLPVSLSYLDMIKSITKIVESELRRNPNVIIRLVMPSFLNPSIYHPSHSEFTFIVPFIHSLRSLLRRYQQNVVMVCSLALDLYPRESHLTNIIESLLDAVVVLQPFNQDMTNLLEKAYKNEPWKIQQGFFNILKIPELSEKGLMLIRDGEFAFKNNKKRFEIEEWGIPVEDDGEEKGQPESQATKISLDF